MPLKLNALLYEWIKALLLNFCGKNFSQNSLIPIQIFNGFFYYLCCYLGSNLTAPIRHVSSWYLKYSWFTQCFNIFFTVPSICSLGTLTQNRKALFKSSTFPYKYIHILEKNATLVLGKTFYFLSNIIFVIHLPCLKCQSI